MKRRSRGRRTGRPPRRSGPGWLLDRMLEPFAPVWVQRRTAARLRTAYMRGLQVRHYDGARTDRTAADWSAAFLRKDAETFPDLQRLIARSRDLRRNTAAGRSIVNSYARNVVGCGITPNADAVGADGESLETFNEALERDFYRWADNPRFCDVEGRLTFWQTLKQAVEQVIESGEYFIHLTVDPDGDGPSALKLQRLEVDSLDTSLTSYGGREVRRGVEIAAAGVPVAYHFLASPLNDLSFAPRRGTVRLPAERVIHLFEQERPGQSHGVPAMSPVLQEIRDLGEYTQWELYACKTQACFSVMINQEGASELPDAALAPEPGSGDDGKDSAGNAENIFEPAMVWRGEPGDQLQGFAPTRPGGSYEPFVVAQQRAIGAGTNLSYGQVSRDYTRGTYSGQRQERSDDQSTFAQWQQLLSLNLCQPVWEQFVTLGVLAGRYEAPGFFDDPLPYLAVEWIGPGMPWIDEHREVKAGVVGLQGGIHTHKVLAARRGRHWRKDMLQRRREQEFAARIGLRGGAGGAGTKSSDGDAAGGRAGNAAARPGPNGRGRLIPFGELR